MNWKVKFIDYPGQFRKMREEVMGTIETVLEKGDLILRSHTEEFERNFASFVGTRYAVGVSNCTDGLTLALLAANIGPGDEVITVSHTFVATAAAIHHTGANPVLIDIGDDHNMDPDCIEQAITPRTKAIVPVHLNGRLCDMTRITEIALARNLIIVEDSAQGLGATLHGKKGGAWGVAGCFSFYPAKVLGTYGDAGVVVTDDRHLAEKVRLLRNHGRLPDGDIAFWSFNCRIDNLHAAILDLKLKSLNSCLAVRRELACTYDAILSEVPQLVLPPPPADNDIYFDIFQNYEIEAEDLDGLEQYLKREGIETMRPWGGRGVHQYAALGLTQYRLPRTDLMFERALLIPMHTELSVEQTTFVATTIADYFS